MTNDIELKTVYDLLEKNFFIPSYQRGYKWEKKQVEDLLEDLFVFANTPNKKPEQFYCLQPVVIKKCSEETIKKFNLSSDFIETYEKNGEQISKKNIWYEVVDGQQRLTTIKIILLYLEKYFQRKLLDMCGKKLFNIYYETRPGTELFFENLVIEKSNQNLKKKYIDYEFMTKAFSVIEQWFTGPFVRSFKNVTPDNARDSIKAILTNPLGAFSPYGTVQVIWYEINETSHPIDIFRRLNIGQIPLTNSELIKALFLQKSKYATEDVDGQQLQIASEWDRIEYSLQNKNFWAFITNLENNPPAHIEYLFDTICTIETDNNQEILEKIGEDKDKTFRYFYNLIVSRRQMVKDKNTDIKVIMDLWDKVTDYFRVLEDWYDNTVLYHYVGFLTYCGKNIADIYKIYKDRSGLVVNNDEFLLRLKDEVKKQIKIFCYKDKKDNYVITKPCYGSKDVGKVLLLLNLEYIIKQKEQNYIKFPFDTFKDSKNKWDIEHIDSYTTNDWKKKRDQLSWLETCLYVIDDLFDKDENNNKMVQAIKDKICLLKNQIEIDTPNLEDDFLELRDTIIELFKEDTTDNTEFQKNSLGNLVLLDYGTNRGYGNALFPYKRKKIIERDKAGQFIPICTKYAFLKYFSKSGTSLTKWNIRDIQQYSNFIYETLKEYITITEEPKNE